MDSISYIPDTIRADMREFAARMRLERVDSKQIGILEKSKEAMLEDLNAIYG